MCFRSLAAAACLTVSSAAWAQTYQQPIEVVAPASFPASFEAGETYAFSRAIATDPEWPDLKVASNREQLSCRIEDHVAYVDFQASDSNWPSLPFRGRCLVNGAYYYIRVEAMDSSLDPSSWQTEVLADAVHMTKRAGSSWMQSFRLPPARQQTVVDGTYVSTLANVTCAVATSATGVQSLTVIAESASVAGTGACSLPSVSGPAYSVDIDLDTVAAW